MPLAAPPSPPPAPVPLRILSFPPRAWAARNPYLELLYSSLPDGVRVEDFTRRRALRGRYDVVHVHWPERVLRRRPTPSGLNRVAQFLALLAWQRLRGAQVVWTVHNLDHHELGGTTAARWFWRLFVPLVDGVISLTDAGRDAIAARFPALRAKPVAVIPIGVYREAGSPAPSRRTARRELGVADDSTVIAYVGLIRPYKNVPGLVAAFRDIEDDDLGLLVGGAPLEPQWGSAIQSAAAGDPRIRLRLDFLPDDELALHLAAADLLALPFTQMFNSSSALLGLSADRPILVPDTPTMRELRDLVGPPWVKLYAAPLDATTLLETARKARSEDRPTSAPLTDFAWDRLAADTAAFYASCVAEPGA